MNSTPTAKMSPLEAVIAFMGIRVGMSIAAALATALFFAVISRSYIDGLRWLQRDGWLLDFYGDIRWSRVWLMGMIIGTFLPNVRIATASASPPESSELISPTNWQLHRPRPGQKFYPTVHYLVYGQTLISGLVCGLFAGCALATTGRARKVLAATTVIISIVLSTLIISKMNAEFEYYVERVQASLQHR